MGSGQHPGSLAERVEETHSNLIGWYVNRGLQREEAEHLAQDAWVRLLLAERRGQTITWPYLWSVATNLLRDHRRRQAAYGGARSRVVSLDAMRDLYGDRLRLADAA